MLILPNIRSYEKYSAIPPDLSLMPKVRDDVSIACMLNPSIFKNLEDECQLISLDEHNWENILTDTKPTFLLAQPLLPDESLSDSNRAQHPLDWNKVTELCKTLGIPTVFWDTENPEEFEQYKEYASLFDHIFVANADCIPLYKKEKQKRNISFLPLGIQIHKHNPVNTTHFGRKDLMTSKSDLLALRENIRFHSYTQRLETMLTLLGKDNVKLSPPGVTILTSTNKPDTLETVFTNYDQQNYEPKEMIVILNNNSLDIEKWRDRASQSNNVTVLRMDESHPLGHCLNEGIENSSFPFVSKFDDDNYYGPNFLTDLMHAFSYTGTEIVGKLSYFCYFEGSQILALMCPGMENRYVNFVSGSGLIIKREVFDSVPFGNKQQGSDSVFLRECVKKGVRMYSADRFNYVYNRQASKSLHTCKISDEVLMRSCQFIDHMDDYREFVSV